MSEAARISSRAWIAFVLLLDISSPQQLPGRLSVPGEEQAVVHHSSTRSTGCWVRLDITVVKVVLFTA